MKYARIVFYAEVVLNLISAALAFFAPAQFVQQYTSQLVPSAPLELIRWYAVLLFVFVYLELRALLSRKNELLALVTEGFLVGDLIQFVAIYMMLNALGEWTLNLIITLVLTLFLAVVRVFWLWQYTRRAPK
jgi:hypothetical protein